MKPCKIFVPCGAVGPGIDPVSFRCGVELHPDIISADAGSTDSGPFYLGTGNCKYARASVKADMRLILKAADELHIPVTIGSAGTCGTDRSVDELADIVYEIAQEEGIDVKVARIYTEQNPLEMKVRYEKGDIFALNGAPDISAETFEECSHIVGLAGIEPFVEAFQKGANVILCGRSTDTAVIAAYPIMNGCHEALSWHAAKTAECGALCTTNPMDGGVFLTIDEESFTVQSTSVSGSCTAYSIFAHLLYENANPLKLTEPGVVIDTSSSVYEELPGGIVRVTGTTLTHTAPTMKLEGSGKCGFQTIAMVGIRDREIVKNPQKWMDMLQAFIQKKLDKLGFERSQYSTAMSAYGYNATYRGPVPEEYVPNEILVMLRVNAKTQEMATNIARIFNPYLLHLPLHKDKPLPSFAFPFSPAELERGEIFEFKLYHCVKLKNPCELIRIVYDFEEGKV